MLHRLCVVCVYTSRTTLQLCWVMTQPHVPSPCPSPTPQVKAVLVNIFGGIVDCATIATGVTKAAKQVGLGIPLVVRVQGTNVETAQRILRESGLPIGTADSLAEAATKAVDSIAS